MKINCSVWILSDESGNRKQAKPGCSLLIYNFKNIEFFDVVLNISELNKAKEIELDR